MLRRFLGNNGTRERGPSLQVLTDEREKVEDALRLATETGKSQTVRVDKQEYIVESSGYGTEIKPA